MFNIFKKVLKKTNDAIKDIIPTKQQKITKDEFEEVLLESDVNYELIEEILEKLPNKIDKQKAENALLEIFKNQPTISQKMDTKPFVEMIIGVNGAGKTTTIAKLTRLYQKQNRKVLLGAGDTFRAAAIEQLSLWAKRLDVPIVATKQGHDPSAVVYDTISSGKAKGVDNIIIDTAGRLHTQTNLAKELQKMVRTANKAMEGTPHRKILILDGTQGSSSINQAKTFNKIIGIDGIIVTKLDGTAKGGSILSIAHEMALPILYIGTGESPDDIIEFNAQKYIETILNEIFI
jgi:fused signal recognition particle receptor